MRSPNSKDAVHGVVFDVAPSELDALDEAEKRGRGYVRQDLAVQGPSSPMDVFAYVAQPAYIDEALLPYDWYHALVLAGAREHSLPAPYIAEIETVRSYPDPNEARRRKHHSILSNAGYPLLSS